MKIRGVEVEESMLVDSDIRWYAKKRISEGGHTLRPLYSHDTVERVAREYAEAKALELLGFMGVKDILGSHQSIIKVLFQGED